jgi:hypothetical protein
MAEENRSSVSEDGKAASSDAGKPHYSAMELLGAALVLTAKGINKAWHAATDDGILAAAFRQGIDELGAALKPFPESIQVQESGALWNPTQGEIAADRQKNDKHTGFHSSYYSSYSPPRDPPHPWPSEIADQNKHQAGKDHGNGHDHGHDAGHSM